MPSVPERKEISLGLEAKLCRVGRSAALFSLFPSSALVARAGTREKGKINQGSPDLQVASSLD